MKINDWVQRTSVLLIASSALVLASGCSEVKNRLGGEQNKAVQEEAHEDGDDDEQPAQHAAWT